MKIAPAAHPCIAHAFSYFYPVGLWQEDIASNLASKAAAENVRAGAENRLHAMEFLEYAYLQTGQYEEAKAIVIEAKIIPPSEVDPRYASYFAIVQARLSTMFATETRDWHSAAIAQPIARDNGWGRGLSLLAHAAAAGHLRDRANARATLQEAETLVEQQTKGKPLPRSGTPEAAFLDEIPAWSDFANRDLHGAIQTIATHRKSRG